jgi:hypothetical protein
MSSMIPGNIALGRFRTPVERRFHLHRLSSRGGRYRVDRQNNGPMLGFDRAGRNGWGSSVFLGSYWAPPEWGRASGQRSPGFTNPLSISGITKDSTGAVLANCTVHLFDANDLERAQGTSDGNGAYKLWIRAPLATPCYIVAYKAGGTDVAGTTQNTLVPAAN